jgi:hypothetical protein
MLFLINHLLFAGMREVWEDGYALKDLAERQAALVQQRESIEAARKVGSGLNEQD